MERLLMMLAATCGHNGKLIMAVTTANFCCLATVELVDYSYNSQTRTLDLKVEGDNSDHYTFGNIVDVAVCDDTYDDTPDYVIDFVGGRLELTVAWG